VNLVVFDIDGTLTQSVAVDEACFVAAFRDVLGIDGIDTDWLAYPHQTDSGLAREIIRRHLGRGPAEGEIDRVRRRFVDLLAAGEPIREVAGASALLRHLGATPGWAVALATGGWEASARFKLDAAGLPAGTLPLASADDALDRPGILRMALGQAARAWGQEGFGQVVYVGDAVWDVRAARELGLAFLGRAAGERADRLLAEGAPTVLADFTDLGQSLRALGVT
jgi:phosphoglycolate phosphatase-like HAD superfamily hydrolase